jgi:hypothetical protein
MSRRREMQDGVKVSIMLDRQMLELVDRLAVKADMERGRLIRNILEMNCRALEQSERVGLFQMSVLLRDLGEDLKVWAKGVCENSGVIGRWTA